MNIFKCHVDDCLYCEVLGIFLLPILLDCLIYTEASVYLQTVGTSVLSYFG